MKDFVKVTVYVNGGSYTLVKKNREKIKKFDYYSKPLNLHGRIEKIAVLEKNTEMELIEKGKEMWYEYFDNYLSQFEKKYQINNKTLSFNIVVEKASEQKAQWCLENLTIQQLLEMGITYLKED